MDVNFYRDPDKRILRARSFFKDRRGFSEEILR